LDPHILHQFIPVAVAVGVGTYLIRSLSLVWGSRLAWPAWLRQWLAFVTPAVLGALLGPALLLPDGHLVLPWHNPALLAAIPTAAVAWYSRNLLFTVLAGVVFYAAAGYLI